MIFALPRKALAGAVLAALAVTGAASLARAQDPDPAGSELQASTWDLSCSAAPDPGALACEASRTLALAGTGQVFLAVFVTPVDRPDAPRHALRLQLPHGVDVPAGVELQVDGQPAAAPAVQTSGPGGLFARTDLTPELLAALRTGAEMTVVFFAITGQRFSVPVPLAGFAAIYDKLDAR